MGLQTKRLCNSRQACTNPQCCVEFRYFAFPCPSTVHITTHGGNIHTLPRATIYPFILLLLTYGLMQLHTRNFRPVVVLWGVLSRVFVQFYRAWNPSSSMIQAFASLFFLSYAKLTYLICEAFAWSPYKSDTGLPASSKHLFYADPNVPYNSTKHRVLMIFSVAVVIFGFLPPLLILLVYPTKLYRQISSHISPKWRIRIKTYSELFHGSFKDGTNGTRDYRFLSVLVLLFFGFVPQLLPLLIKAVLQDTHDAPLYIHHGHILQHCCFALHTATAIQSKTSQCLYNRPSSHLKSSDCNSSSDV